MNPTPSGPPSGPIREYPAGWFALLTNGWVPIDIRTKIRSKNSACVSLNGRCRDPSVRRAQAVNRGGEGGRAPYGMCQLVRRKTADAAVTERSLFPSSCNVRRTPVRPAPSKASPSILNGPVLPLARNITCQLSICK